MPVRVLFVLAFRNLRRHLRRSLLTAAAMGFGGILIVFTFTLADGSHEQWIDSAVRLSSGHLSIERPEYRPNRRIDHRLDHRIRQAAEAALGAPELAAVVSAVSARLTINGLALAAAGTRPARLVAVDPLAERAFGPLDERIVEGRYLEPGDRLAAVVGAELRDRLDLRIGSRLVVQAQDTEREIAGQLLRVVGVFRTGSPGIDQGTIHLPLGTAGEWLGSGSDVTGISVALTSSRATPGVMRRLAEDLAEPVRRGEASVRGWRETDPALAAALAIDALGNGLMLGFLFLIIAFAIVNTVLMSVMHRNREFGVLRALGVTPGASGALVLIEGLTLSGLSGLSGVGLGLLLTWFFFGDGLDFSALMANMEGMTFAGTVIDPVIQPLFRARRMAEITLFILAVGVAASVYPALRAARIDMTEAVKFDR